jgi:hypothetical protein
MPTATYQGIESAITNNATTPTITFQNIPATFTDLVLVFNAKPATTPTSFGVSVRFNSDSTSAYTRTFYYGYSSYGAQSSASYATRMECGNGGTTTANQFSCGILEIMNYANTAVFKTCIARNTEMTDVTAGQVLLWSNTSAINRVDVFASDAGNFASGCTFGLYGIKAA